MKSNTLVKVKRDRIDNNLTLLSRNEQVVSENSIPEEWSTFFTGGTSPGKYENKLLADLLNFESEFVKIIHEPPRRKKYTKYIQPYLNRELSHTNKFDVQINEFPILMSFIN